MKNSSSITELFAEICGSVSTQRRSGTREVNGVTYFWSKWSQSWHPESERSGKHNYTAKEVAIWSKIYRAVEKQRPLVTQLKLEGKVAESEALKRKLDTLWEAKDNAPELYESVRGFTDAELDALASKKASK